MKYNPFDPRRMWEVHIIASATVLPRSPTWPDDLLWFSNESCGAPQMKLQLQTAPSLERVFLQKLQNVFLCFNTSGKALEMEGHRHSFQVESHAQPRN